MKNGHAAGKMKQGGCLPDAGLAPAAATTTPPLILRRRYYYTCLSSTRSPDATSGRDLQTRPPDASIIRKILEQANSTNDRQLCEDHLGLLHPALRAATVSLLRARRDLHLAQTKRFARDVIFDLLLDGQLLAVPPV